MKTILFAVLSLIPCIRAENIPLPGEPATKPALVCDPFPSRLYAFVWKNWTCVPVGKMAKITQASVGQITSLAADLGLPPQKAVEPEWMTKGYITVLRRNWHLLPYSQLLMLLDKTREQLRYCLQEDDFLFIKLGSIKPLVEPLVYADPTTAEREAARHLAGLLARENLPAVEEEPRFAFIPPLAHVSPDLPAEAPTKGGSPFSFRMIFSYFADYGDPLSDPEIGSFPEGLLQRLAARGVNAVWMHTVLNTLAKDPAYPEFGEGCERRMANLRKLIARAKKYGIEVILYMNEPRGQEEFFFKARPGREAIQGVKEALRCALCTSSPEVRRWMHDAIASVFRQAPGLGGIFTISASENVTSCAAHAQEKKCPRCKNRSRAEIIAEVNTTLAQGMADGAKAWNGSPKMLVWDWGWRDEDVKAIIERLPKTCWFMTVSEIGVPIERGGIKGKINEYSISGVGPSGRALQRWGWARAAGLKTAAKIQAGSTWELSSLPYLPAMNLVAEHARNLANADVNGVMLSWSLGCYPSPNLEIFQTFRKGDKRIENVLGTLAKRFYGEQAAPFAVKAWESYSDGFREFPFHISSVYVGPQHWGPANPLYLNATGWRATMVGIPYDDIKSWCSVYPPEIFALQMQKVADGFQEGSEFFRQAIAKAQGVMKEDAEKELGIFEAARLHLLSSAQQTRFVLARDAAMAAEGEEKEAKIRQEKKWIKAEREAARALLPLCQKDSRIGYECSNHYFFIPQDLREKIVLCDWMLEQLGKPSPESRK